MKTVDVALGIVVNEGRLLVCRRGEDNPVLGGFWEFPGGKKEPGETIEECLHRELAEELGIEVAPIGHLPAAEHAYPAVKVRLHSFLCRLTSGDPRPIGCQQVRWVRPEELDHFPFPPANAHLLEAVRHRLRTNPPPPPAADP